MNRILAAKTPARRLTVAAITAALALSGCSSGSSDGMSSDTTKSDAGTITIVDHTGEEVEIPAEIERVAIDEIPIASTYLAYHGGEAPHLVGMSQAVVDSLQDTVVAEMAPEILDVDSSYYSDGELNVETLLTLKPDVVFYNANNSEHGELFEAAGIPAVGFATSGDPTTVYVDWLNLLEEVFQEPGKTDAIVEYGQELVIEAQQRAGRVTDDARKNAMIIFNYSAGTLRVAGETPFFGYYWLQTANADNAAVGAEQPLAPVNAEQVLAWDPDVVLIGGSGQAGLTVDQLLGNTADGLDLASLRAVQEGEVYSNGLGMWSWFTPNPDAPLVANWIGSVIYPELFGDADLTGMTQDYYERVYNFELTAEQAESILLGSTSE
ncbi:MAG: ABC transporter substrate-binding protein [Rhodococcus sp. (in: high G+C Gram-positive bacteria)]|uniref:ABC transporter substrate-binding protein n=1 Tax=Rhodococcus sp. TaxID=1831 RepID=UPI003BB54B68